MSIAKLKAKLKDEQYLAGAERKDIQDHQDVIDICNQYLEEHESNIRYLERAIQIEESK